MCFRPAEMQMNKCPVCGKMNKPIAKECAECGAPLQTMKVDFDADQAKLDAMNMMGAAPMAPGAPMAPNAPMAPGAPKPPSAPKAPAAPKAPGQ